MEPVPYTFVTVYRRNNEVQAHMLCRALASLFRRCVFYVAANSPTVVLFAVRSVTYSHIFHSFIYL